MRPLRWRAIVTTIGLLLVTIGLLFAFAEFSVNRKRSEIMVTQSWPQPVTVLRGALIETDKGEIGLQIRKIDQQLAQFEELKRQASSEQAFGRNAKLTNVSNAIKKNEEILLTDKKLLLALKRDLDANLQNPANDEELLAQSLARLPKGNLAYSTPEKMKTGQTAHVVARIGSDEISVNALKSGLPTDQGTATASVASRISTKMKMTLKSADFDITPVSSEEQFVAGDTPTTWQWDISPKHSGKLRLHLAAVVVLNNLARDFTTVDREIAVQVDPIDAAETFAKANGVWILTTLGAGLAGSWAFLKKRKNPKRQDPPTWEKP
jgi:hypothetical protein